MTALLVNTPYYVLLDGNQRLGPKLLPPHAGSQAVAIYGFSNKPHYDAFCAKCEIAVTPYPLVKGYLQNQLSDSNETIRLVVVDAAAPNEAQLNAAAMKDVLEAQEQKSDRVNISFHLMLDQGSQAYRIEKASSDRDAPRRPAEPQRA